MTIPSLGPGIPEPAQGLPVPLQEDPHRLPEDMKLVGTPVLGGLHRRLRFGKLA